MPPVVSVLVTCHDLGAFLDEAVSSVLEQTLTDVEILIVDDGSTDPATCALLDGFTRPRTTLFRTPSRGLAAARNFLIQRATGRYLCALDADDRLHPSYLEKAVARLEADPGLTFVSSWLEAFGAETWVWRQERCDLVALLAEDTVMTAALVRRDAVLAAGGYDEAMPAPGDEDWELWLRLVAAGHRGAIIPEVLFFYRRRPGSMSLDCVRGDTHLALARYLMTKHAGLYRQHLAEVLALKDREIASLLRESARLEEAITRATQTAAIRREEVASLDARLAAPEAAAWPAPQGVPPRGRLAAYARELEASRAEVAALRGSWSWRVTAPLRTLYDLLHGRRSGGGS